MIAELLHTMRELHRRSIDGLDVFHHPFAYAAKGLPATA